MENNGRLTKYAAALFVAVVGAIALYAWGTAAPRPAPSDYSGSRVVRIGGREVKAAVADTPEARQRGLGGRSGLAQDEGMLFVFPAEAKYGFWMKDMRFPIDIVWLSGAGTVVDVAKSVSSASYPAVFEPKAPARYVLELPAGFSEAYSVSIGDMAGL